jgi:hypothetical protein
MITLVETVRINNDQTVKTDAGEFYAEQRNAGFEPNDGAWVVTQLPELYWSGAGVLRQRRPEKFLGVFATPELAVAAIEGAELQPIEDRMVR